MRFGDQRAHVIRDVCTRADLEVVNLGLELRNDRIGGFIAHTHRNRYRHAAFTAGAKGGAHECADGVIDIRIGHDGYRHPHRA
jgi:hypothetical protein